MKSLRLFILAGEPSGDKIGADLIMRLRKHTKLELAGVGGASMQSEGLISLFPMTDLSVMGLFDVLKRLPKLLWRLRQCVALVSRFDPDVVVLIDSQEFSNLLARKIRKQGFDKPLLLYVSPTVWAWRPERAAKMKSIFNEVLAIFPFEPEVMVRLSGPPTRFVGHPATVNNIPDYTPEKKNKIALLPGSRAGELKRHLAMFGTVGKALHAKYPQVQFFLPTLDHLENRLKIETAYWGFPVEIVCDGAQKLALYAQTRLALVASGTATLELAFAGVPMLVTHVMDMFQKRMLKKFGLKYFSLPNIIIDRLLVPEQLFETPDADILFKKMDQLLSNPGDLKLQIQGFRTMAELMDKGTADFPRVDPAERVLSHIGKKSAL